MTARVWATGPAGHTPMTAAMMNGIEADLDARPPKWAPSTAYAAGQQVVSPNNDIVSAIATFTSGTVFNQANWALSTTYAPVSGSPNYDAAGDALVNALIFGGK